MAPQEGLPPLLVVAGTADLRVPAAEEARRIQAEAPSPCAVHPHSAATAAGLGCHGSTATATASAG